MPQIAVAVPVRDEAALIGDCLRALALQQGVAGTAIVLLVNNSVDGTADIARALAPVLPCRLHVLEHCFASAQASAGHARRVAMGRAADFVGEGGVVLTTDADGCVTPDWLERNLAALAAGADVVCGRAAIDPVDALAIPQHLHDDDAREVEYGWLLDRIASLLDPDPADPWPRHTEESGASIAVRRDVLLAAGGVPAVRSGEDRALVAALRRIDARIRHDPGITVTVSGRVVGRAEGGMAETIRRRIGRQDPMVDRSMEPVANRVTRIAARRAVRRLWHGGGAAADDAVTVALADRLHLSLGRLQASLCLRWFGTAWAAIEEESPMLRQREVARSDLPAQTDAARRVLGRIRLRTDS